MTGETGIAGLERRTVGHLDVLYPDRDNRPLARRLIETLELTDVAEPAPPRNKWDQADAVLITYGNSIVRPDERPLQTLRWFLGTYVADAFNSVHVLPFFPYSSDDGFAVLNYLQVNSALGEWRDVEAIASDFRLMADLVINHASSRSQWFENFRRGADPGRDYFFTVEPGTDVSQVVRPRPSPLLQQVATAGGDKLVWCTFGPDQVDLDFSNPQVLSELVNIMARYLDAGVRILRLDAVAFLWKEPGTPCVHLQQTHQIVKLLRDLAEAKCPDALIITETNVPVRDNLTYFGNANEAHAIYNFSLPPLLIYALLSGDCRHLKTWMMSMPPAQTGTFYLNFIASHDGIGLRPAEGLLDEDELELLLEALKRFGGHISMRADTHNTVRPYEANIALWNALSGTLEGDPDEHQLGRFLCAHAIMLGLEGVPAIYLHSLFATPNDTHAVEHSRRYRSINRHVWDAGELTGQLDNPRSRPATVLSRLKDLLRIRALQPAFHPNAIQFTLHMGLKIFGFWRQSVDRRQSIFCLTNVSSEPQELDLGEVNLIDTDEWTDLITGMQVEALRGRMTLAPYQTVWLTNVRSAAASGRPA